MIVKIWLMDMRKGYTHHNVFCKKEKSQLSYTGKLALRSSAGTLIEKENASANSSENP